jgi:hypothetical protein
VAKAAFFPQIPLTASYGAVTQQQYFNSELQSSQAWFAELQNYVQLYQALGGGWRPPSFATLDRYMRSRSSLALAPVISRRTRFAPISRGSSPARIRPDVR